MDRVGGDIRAYRALCEDARAEEDVRIWLAAEHKAATLTSLKVRAKGER